MRVLLLSLALCCLVHYATPQTFVDSVEVDDVTFSIYATDAPGLDLTLGNPCPDTGLGSSQYLAVFESDAEYEELIEAMIAKPVTAGEISVGLDKSAGDSVMRTSVGERPASYVNFKNDPAVTAPLSGARLAVMDFNPAGTDSKYVNFLYSPWFLADDHLFVDGDLFMCMDREDEACEGDDCHDNPRDTRVEGKTCFWNPYPRCLFTWKEAKEVCYKRGGHLMDLIDDEDIDRLKDWTEDYPTYANLFLGLKQLNGDGTPTWTSNDEQVDEQDAWNDPINYGSSSNYFPYTGIWNVGSEGMNLYEVANGADGTEVKAFATCEAPLEDFCKYSSPEVKYAEKTVCCDYQYLRYTCKVGWEFPDGEIEKEIPCGCDVDFHYPYIPDCILKNPCKYDSYLCQPHGECIFTNQPAKPYYCVCGPGFEWDDVAHNCVDINECLDNPCGPYGGHCMNTVGSYWCTCNKGSSWDNGYCSQDIYPTLPPVVAVHTMTIYFHVNMNYNPDMNAAGHISHEQFREALDHLAYNVYTEETITVDGFYVSDEDPGKMKVKVVFNLYIAADVTTVSKYVWKFYSYIKNADYFTVNYNTYPYYGSVYFQSATVSTNIAITSPCSIFDSIGQCYGSYCSAEHYTPICHCHPGYYGTFCNEHDRKPEKPVWEGDLTDTEIGLIVAVCILFLLVICMPFCLICCMMHCRCFQSRRRVHHHDHEYYTPNAYSQSPTYVSKTTQVAPRFPKFRIM